MKNQEISILHSELCSVQRIRQSRVLVWRFAAAALLLLLAAIPGGAQSAQTANGASPSDQAIITLDEVERGMSGYGVSVFSGTELKRFDVEVVGKLENLNPGLSFIMANLAGENLEETGVIGGMSGSPVYLDGRLAGAVAFSWSFAQGALAGITPIEAMRDLAALPGGASDVGSGRGLRRVGADDALDALLSGDFSALLQRGHTNEDLTAWLRRTNSSGVAAFSGAGVEVNGAAPAMQLLTVGFDARARDLLLSSSPWGGQLRAGGSAGRTDQDTALPPLAAGGPVAAMLVGGDLIMAVNGTVTERRGDEILAFGHPYLGLGPVSLPMAKAEVVAVVSSRMSSFKLSNIGEVVGAFDEDRLAGMRGQVGAVAKTSPMTVKVRHPSEGETHFDLELADFEPMRPMLVASSALQCIESATRSAGNGGFDLEATFGLAGREDLVIRQSFDGNSTAIDAAIYLLQVTAFLELTDLAEIDVESIDVVVDQYDGIRTLDLLDVYADQRSVRPGDTIALRLKLRGYRGEVRTEVIETNVPADAAPGSYYLFVGDGVSVNAARNQIQPVRDRNFDRSLDRLRELRSARDLVVMAVRPGPGVVSDGGALPSLPASLRSVWKSSSAGQVKGVSLTALSEVATPYDVPLSGVGRVDLVVRREPKS